MYFILGFTVLLLYVAYHNYVNSPKYRSDNKMEFLLHYESITGKSNTKIFRNVKHALDYVKTYQIDSVVINFPDDRPTEVYTDMNEFERIYENEAG